VGCCHYFVATEGGADSFTVEMPRIMFGRGVMEEVGERVRAQEIKRAVLFTDPYLADSKYVAQARKALTDAGVDAELYAEATGIPNRIGGVGLTREDVEELAASVACQRRAIGNSPRDTTQQDIEKIFARAR